MKQYRHLFFDMDETIAPSRQTIRPEMYELLSSLPYDIVVVSGQTVEKIVWQSNRLRSITLGQNGNHATDEAGNELWHVPLDELHRQEILEHIKSLSALLDSEPNPVWDPIEDRGAQITFSPVGNTAPVELKKSYDPDGSKRAALLRSMPFHSEDLAVKIAGSTSIDYIHKDRHKGANIEKLLSYTGWNKRECVYFGDKLHSGGNDESVIGVIDTIAVNDHRDTYQKLRKMLER